MEKRDKDPESVSSDARHYRFIRMTSKICQTCLGATGGSRMGVIADHQGTSTIECENPACQTTEFYPTRALK